MSVEDLRRQISEKRQKLDELKRDMGETSVGFVAAAAAFLRDWYPAMARQTVTQSPGITEKIEEDQLRTIKDQVRELAESSEEIARRHFNRDELWWHRTEKLPNLTNTDLRSAYMILRQRGVAKLLEAPLRAAMGELGPILEKHGYLKRDSIRGESRWTGDSYGGNSQRSFPGHFEFPASLHDLNKAYDESFGRALTLSNEIESLERKVRETQTGSAWDAL